MQRSGFLRESAARFGELALGSCLIDEPIPSGDTCDARQGDHAASDTELRVVQVVTDDSEQVPKFVAYGRRIAAKDDGGSHDVVISRCGDLASGRVAHWFLGLVEEGEDVEVCHERGVSGWNEDGWGRSSRTVPPTEATPNCHEATAGVASHSEAELTYRESDGERTGSQCGLTDRDWVGRTSVSPTIRSPGLQSASLRKVSLTDVSVVRRRKTRSGVRWG